MGLRLHDVHTEFVRHDAGDRDDPLPMIPIPQPIVVQDHYNRPGGQTLSTHNLIEKGLPELGQHPGRLWLKRNVLADPFVDGAITAVINRRYPDRTSGG
jgi:hypothetical protein